MCVYAAEGERERGEERVRAKVWRVTSSSRYNCTSVYICPLKRPLLSSSITFFCVLDAGRSLSLLAVSPVVELLLCVCRISQSWAAVGCWRSSNPDMEAVAWS